MLGFQPTDLIGILIVALLIFGPSRLPQIGKALGSTIREFQSATREATSSFREEYKPEDAKPAKPVAQSSATCKNCNQPVQTDMRFCPECGAAQ